MSETASDVLRVKDADRVRLLRFDRPANREALAAFQERREPDFTRLPASGLSK